MVKFSPALRIAVVSLLALWIMCLASACGKPEKTDRRFIDPAFDPHVQLFEDRSGIRINFPVVFEDLSVYPRVVGACFVFSNGDVDIRVDPTRTMNYSYYQMEQLILHELGHCVLGKAHDNSRIDFPTGGRFPASIMVERIFNDREIVNYLDNREYYLYDLIGR